MDCVRTAGGRRGGSLSGWHPVDLGAQVIDALVTRGKFPGELVDDVVFGCVDQIGAQAGNIGRLVVLASKSLPESVPGVTVDRQCGSGQQAIHFAAQAVMSGTQDVVIAGGVEIMSLVPIGSNVFDGMKNGRGVPNSPALTAKYKLKDPLFSQFNGAETVAEKYEISREEMEKFALLSHKRAAEATRAGKFESEILPITGINPKITDSVVLKHDEGIRWPTSLDKLKSLPTLKSGGRLTAATASQITDGAAAVLICNEQGLKKLGLKPRAKIVSMALAGTDPVSMLTGPIPASEKALKKLSKSINDIDLYEVNEAFACVPLAWAKALQADIKKLNVNGGAIALGHPLGATGAKLMTTLVNELEKRRGRYGLLAICEGGGTANATIIERIDSASNATSKL